MEKQSTTTQTHTNYVKQSAILSAIYYHFQLFLNKPHNGNFS